MNNAARRSLDNRADRVRNVGRVVAGDGARVIDHAQKRIAIVILTYVHVEEMKRRCRDARGHSFGIAAHDDYNAKQYQSWDRLSNFLLDWVLAKLGYTWRDYNVWFRARRALMQAKDDSK